MKKIFDFNDTNLMSGLVGRPRELSWPCMMYHITMPSVNAGTRRDYNAFEWCILKLLACRSYEPNELAEETCLPQELILVILLRLYDRQKIDNDYHVLPETLQAIEQSDTTNDVTPSHTKTYVIFRECIGNTLLPMVYDASLKAEEIDENAKGLCIKQHGQRIGLHQLQEPNHEQKAPKPVDVISCLRIMARRNRWSKESLQVPSGCFIAVSDDGEPCCIRVRIVIQQSGDWRILNPFGLGWSPELEISYQAFLKKNDDESESFQQWQQDNRNNETKITQVPDARKNEPYDTPENKKKYPQLIQALRRSTSSYGEHKELDIHSILEWTLFYSLQHYDLKKYIDLFKIDTLEGNRKLLEDTVQALEKDFGTYPFKNPDSAQIKDSTTSGNRRKGTSIQVPLPGKLDSFMYEGMAELQVLVPLAILLAKDEPRFPLTTVIKRYPDWLSRLQDIKARRDKKRHGKSKIFEIYNDSDYQFMRDFVTILLPSVQFAASSSSDTKDSDDSTIIQDVQFDARVDLQEIFGVSSFNQLDRIIQDSLIEVEVFRKKFHADEVSKANAEKDIIPNGIDSTYCINNLYSALECTFRGLLGGARPETYTIATIEEKIRKAGWRELPESLRTVRAYMIQLALEGDDRSLGACVDVWLLKTDVTTLHQVKATIPSFLEIIHRLLRLRGHANEACLLSGDELDTLCHNIYMLIRLIKEI